MVHRPRLAADAAAQRRVLEDPLGWQHEIWDAIFGSGPFDRLVPAAPVQSAEHFHEAVRLAELAAGTPGADVGRAIGVAGDMANGYAGEVGCFGMELEAILEQLRHGLLAYLRRVEVPPVWDADNRASLAADRAALVALGYAAAVVTPPPVADQDAV